MAFKYKHQTFQTEAVNNICDVFAGQPKQGAESNYIIDKGTDKVLLDIDGFGNAELKLSPDKLCDNIRRVQQRMGLKPIDEIEGGAADLKLTVEMDTGTGKTYTYIKTIFELNKRFGWRKFVIVVPSIAIREGVLSSLKGMKKHFEEQYEGIINFFVYNSKQLQMIDQFSRDSNIHVMIINTQAFNSTVNEEKNKEGRSGDAAARIIFTEQDSFGSRKPIDVIAANRPIIIIDEPQSVLGADKKNNTRKGILRFNPLFTLLYSATHRDIYNMVFRLDAIDALNKKLVKQIEVVGVKQVGSNATHGYVSLEEIVTDDKNYPRARLCFERKTKNGVKQEVRLCKDGDDLFVLSGELQEYKDNFVISIDGAAGTVSFLNGQSLQVGEVIGAVNEEAIRQIQIRLAIKAHLEKERKLFAKGIKVLSLFFIDHVEHYRIYKEGGEVENGPFAKMFEDVYEKVKGELQFEFGDEAYIDFLNSARNSAQYIHKGYFSKDGRGKSKTKEEEEQSAYDLIMRDKEGLLSFDEPCRFIFSHSALKEGWDNPNVFVICTLKDTQNEIKKRQEVGRGMRLCVNSRGERQDADVLGEDHVFDYNCLTVVASESYEDFASKLQKEMAEVCRHRPTRVDMALFKGMVYTTAEGESCVVSEDDSRNIYEELVCNGYVKKGMLTEKYHDDKRAGKLDFGEANGLKEVIVKQLDTVFDPQKFKPGNRAERTEAKFRKDKFNMPEWQNLWKRINHRSTYQVNFDSALLIEKAVKAIDDRLTVAKTMVVVTRGTMSEVKDTNLLMEGNAMKDVRNDKPISIKDSVGKNVSYDLVGELVTRTGLTRRTVVEILKGIKKDKLCMFADNPDDFIIKAGNIINEQKALSVVEKIQYNRSDKTFDSTIFSDSMIRGVLGDNAIRSERSLFDMVVCDSKHTEMEFANKLEHSGCVEVYTKLPGGFYINTPLGKYNPDWAIVFKEGTFNHIYFVAETKGSNSVADLRPVEAAKIECAKRHFESLGHEDLKYDFVDSFDKLLELLR